MAEKFIAPKLKPIWPNFWPEMPFVAAACIYFAGYYAYDFYQKKSNE